MTSWSKLDVPLATWLEIAKRNESSIRVSDDEECNPFGRLDLGVILRVQMSFLKNCATAIDRHELSVEAWRDPMQQWRRETNHYYPDLYTFGVELLVVIKTSSEDPCKPLNDPSNPGVATSRIRSQWHFGKIHCEANWQILAFWISNPGTIDFGGIWWWWPSMMLFQVESQCDDSTKPKEW